MNVIGEDLPSDDDFLPTKDSWVNEVPTWACIMCGLLAADRDLHRDFHRWMNGTARKSEA